MNKHDLVGATITGISEVNDRLWSIEVKLVTGELVEIETGDEFLPLVVTVE